MTDAQASAELGGRLLVLSGVHAGAAARFGPHAALAVGADESCDVILADAGMSARQLEISAFAGRASITALAPGVVLDDGRPLLPRSRRIVSLPARVRLGDAVELLIDEDAVARGRDGRRRRSAGRTWQRRAAVPALAAVAVAVAAGLWLLGSAAPLAWQSAWPSVATAETSAAAAAAVAPTAVPPPTAPAPAAAPPPPDPAAAAAALAARLAGTGLARTLAARADGAVVRVAGRVPQAQTGAWREVRVWYDTSFGGRTPLVAEVEQQTTSDAPPFAVRALWLGSEPYFLASDGRRYEPGSVTRDGWRVERIGDDGIFLQRPGETLRLAL